MFEEQNKNSGVEDILAATESASAPEVPLGPPSALAGGKLQPVRADGVMAPAAPLEQAANAGRAGFPIKKIIALAAAVLLVGGGATAGYFWWQGRNVGNTDAVMPLGQPGGENAPKSAGLGAGNTEPGENVLNQSLNEFQQKAAEKVLDPLSATGDNNNVPAAAANIDTDQDGLSDASEAAGGSNPNLVDTDGDSLSDWEEATIFGTDPLNSDTDGDTYSDGAEVQQGYNPKGPGKLLDFEKAKTQAQ